MYIFKKNPHISVYKTENKKSISFSNSAFSSKAIIQGFGSCWSFFLFVITCIIVFAIVAAVTCSRGLTP